MTTEDTKAGQKPGAGWYAAAAVVVLVVAGLVYVLARGRAETPSASGTSTTSPTGMATSGSSSPSESTSSSPSSPVTSAAAGWAVGGCKGGTGSSEDPGPTLAAVTWEPFRSASVPVSTEVGPGTVEAPLRRCYQHSPAGAVVAAVNIVTAAAVPAEGVAVVKAQWTPGPGQDKALSDAASATGSMANVAAYRLTGCTPERCNVELVFFGGGIYINGMVPMTWSGSDWLVDGAVHVGEPGPAQGIPPGFTAWGPRT